MAGPQAAARTGGQGVPMVDPITTPPRATLVMTAPAPKARQNPPPAAPASAPAPKAGPKAAPSHASGWHEILSSLNPLQYVPVVGTIYRSVTDDTIPETNRMVGSMVFSGLTGGPMGVATSALTSLFEKLTGIDPERIGRSLLVSLGIAKPAPAAAPPVQQAAASPIATPGHTPPTAKAAPPAPVTASASAPARGFTAAQLAAYGVHQDTDGRLQRGTTRGADVLNDLELARLGTPSALAAAYGTPQIARTQPG